MTHRILIRADLNVPIENGHIQDDSRLKALLPHLLRLDSQRSAITLISHLGRPSAYDPQYSLQPIQQWLSQALGEPVEWLSQWPQRSHSTPGWALAENLRFLPGEINNDPTLVSDILATFDHFIFEAFGSAHRDHASITGLIQHSSSCELGPLVQAEVAALHAYHSQTTRPHVALIGGSKIASKLGFLDSLLPTIDHLLLGGGLANTVLVAQGLEVGNSLYDTNELSLARDLIQHCQHHAVRLHTPMDARGASSLQHAPDTFRLTNRPPEALIYDIGPETEAAYLACIQTAQRVLWTGPMGLYEHPAYQHGSFNLARALATLPAETLLGGGDTLAVINQAGIDPSQFTHTSTGGSAFLGFTNGLLALNTYRNRA